MRKYLSIDSFKAMVKVGDLLQGYTTGKIVRVTAIGESRFLYRDINGYSSKERVSKIQNLEADWRPVTNETNQTV